MNKSRLPMLIVSVCLAAVIGIAIFSLQRTIRAESSYQALPAGMGDLQRYEAQQSHPAGGVEANSRPYAGMGDLHLFEAQQIIPATGGQVVNRPYIGMGDLRLFEAQQEKLNK